MRRFALGLFFAVPLVYAACAVGNNQSGSNGGSAGAAGNAGAAGATTTDSTDAGTTSTDDDGGLGLPDADPDAAVVDPDAACASTVEKATTTQLPVDIVWMVDNSSSMLPAINAVTAGLNDFAALIASKNLDYKVIMLSLRSPTSPVSIGGSNRYPVCIPQPLAGDAMCGNGPRFFQSSIDIRSTQPLEQFLGTLGQTDGYQMGQAKGGEPWAQELRPEATKTIVVVTDDNSRLSPTDFETFAGGKNPFNSLTLPPGILDPSWNGIFKDYVFSGIYGWGDANDPGVTCTYGDGTSPPSPGPTYTTLVNKTKGVRAKICDSAGAWGPFFDAVAQAVEQTSKLSCDLEIPTPQNGTLDPDAVNVQIVVNEVPQGLAKVAGAAACGPSGGWYYDNDAMPTHVILCPASCDVAQASVGPGKNGRIEILFGCATIVM
ncbi:MAG: hypothetical protein U0441_15005 [Polyangiaceae bacterium]